MNVSISKAKENEIESALGLLKELYLELGEEAESIKSLDSTLINQQMRNGRTEIFLAKTSNRKAVGIITITECQSIYAGGKYGLIDEMYVKPEYRSKSIGKKMVDNVKCIAGERGWKRIDVTAPTEVRWNRTVKFYEGCGFVFTGPKLKFAIEGRARKRRGGG